MAKPSAVVLRALGLGDLLTAVPALRALRAALPEHRIVLVAAESLAPLAALSGAVDAVRAPAAQDGRGVPTALAPELHRADVAVNLHGRGPGSTELLRATRPGRLVAWDGGWREDEHEVQRWCRLLDESGIPADPTALDLCPPARRSPAPGATVIHPGAASAARRWPAERWRAVAEAERAAGREVVASAGPGEEGLARALGVPVVSPTDLEELCALVAGAGRVACADTGIAHLATAFAVPSVVLFGPTDPARWGPPADRADRHVALWKGRTGDPHAVEPDPGLVAIEPSEVITALARPSRDPRFPPRTRGYGLAS